MITESGVKRSTSLSLYWKCQIAGWSAASLYWALEGWLRSARFDLRTGLIAFLSDVAIYIWITHLYRNFALASGWQDLELAELVKRIFPAILVMAVAYLLVTGAKLFLLHTVMNGENPSFYLASLKADWLALYMAGIRLMAIWILAYHLYHYAQREIRIRYEHAQFAVLAKTAQLQHLASQLNPHFLFNSLNTIKALVLENPRSARRGIDLLSDLLRSGISDQTRQMVTLTEELNLVSDYLELEKLRLEARLQVSLDIDPSLDTLLILRLAIQTLVENAVKHGIAQQQGGLITIKVKQVRRSVVITVENPGTLRADRFGGVGLANLRERLKLQYGTEGIFQLSAQPGGMVRSVMQVPVR